MNREPDKPEPVTEKKDEEQECSEVELKEVSGGVQTRQKGPSPGFGPGTSISV